MLISSRNSLIETPRRVFNQMSGFSTAGPNLQLIAAESKVQVQTLVWGRWEHSISHKRERGLDVRPQQVHEFEFVSVMLKDYEKINKYLAFVPGPGTELLKSLGRPGDQTVFCVSPKGLICSFQGEPGLQRDQDTVRELGLWAPPPQNLGREEGLETDLITDGQGFNQGPFWNRRSAGRAPKLGQTQWCWKGGAQGGCGSVETVPASCVLPCANLAFSCSCVVPFATIQWSSNYCAFLSPQGVWPGTRKPCRQPGRVWVAWAFAVGASCARPLTLWIWHQLWSLGSESAVGHPAGVRKCPSKIYRGFCFLCRVRDQVIYWEKIWFNSLRKKM